MDLERLRASFSARGLTPLTASFAEVCADLGPHWRDRLVVYQSAEDPNLEYRSYVEDVVLGLELMGARVMPRFRFLRAHHNKVFGEILTRAACGNLAARPRSWCYGCLEEMAPQTVPAPVVVKSARGAGSSGIALATDPRRARRLARAFSRSPGWIDTAKELVKRRLRRDYVAYSVHRRKFILQEFLPGLTHDFKVLCYGERLFVLRRDVRPGDFRASGSGRFSWPDEPGVDLLDYAFALHTAFGAPCSSLDIAATDRGYQLLEAQFVVFGPLTLEASRWHFHRSKDGWRRVEGPSVLEDVFADCIRCHADAQGWIE